MKKVFFYAVIVLITVSSCSKEALLSSDEPVIPGNGILASNGVDAVPIYESATFEYLNFAWNPCLQEWIELRGTGHYQLRGMISEGKITFVLHFNLSDVKGLGLSSSTEYITTQTFNYSNTASFTGEQRLYQQSASIRFIVPGGEGSFTIINDWHLTVNANGTETFFFTTGGDVIECQ